ncbi:Uncharacterized protein TRE1 [Cyberlindnera fabianii]|uniref:Uncharacterized protein TRE1 n=1 Tax=Cyberlindnera fabianii TaxID=36022 RepID=A0A1V2L5X6_CYBFA|nr:Uncharacterized protein TRE1 [Cyberlindnera fabianii]
MRYNELPTEPPAGSRADPPAEPPAYDGGDSFDLEDNARLDQLEEEIEAMEFEDPPQRSLRERVSHYREQLSHKWVSPMRQNVLDPLAEGYVYLNRKWESGLARLGNPLIVKRFVYVIAVAAVLWVVMASGFLPDDSSRTYGSFSDRETLLEFGLQSIDMKNIEENLEYLGSLDHIAGTSGDLSTARYVEAFFKGKGFSNTQFEEIPVTLNYPGKTTLKYDDKELDLTEQFNPLSKEGSATGKLLYVNYGRVKDFESLKEKNIDAKDCICLIKFGSLPSSQKMMIADNYGCSGVLFTSENDDFPDSYERRGVGMPELFPGDPRTPGWSSQTANSFMGRDEVSMARIPSVSLTWNQASELWQKLGDKGVVFEDGFHSGEKELEVTLNNSVVYKEKHPIWNVLAKIDGREQSDHALFIGAQRDAPCKGAIMPDTGTVVLLELAQLFQKLMSKFNWTPLRSIYFISLDGTEYNLSGATELIEVNVHGVRKETMMYLDLSDAVAGDHIEVRGSSLLSRLLDNYRDEYNLTTGQQFDEYGNFVPFMGQGIPVVDIGYKGGKYPKYTCDDTFENFQKSNMDPGYDKHRKLVEFVLKFALNLVEDPLIPFDITSYVEQMNQDFKDLQNYAEEVQPGNKYDFAPLTASLLEVKQLGKDLDIWRRAWTEIVEEDSGLEPSLLAVHRWSWNSRLAALEKLFLSENGLTGRPWYKNPVAGPQVFKPDNGLGSWWTFPGVRDAIYMGLDVQKEINTAAQLITDGCKYFVQG